MLPILLSIPHGGSCTPEELIGRTCITPRDLFDDGDACTHAIYDLDSDVAGVIKTDIARAFVDMNRSPEQRPPQHPDGVVKSATCLARPIYHDGCEPDDNLVNVLIGRYHTSYHARIEQAISDSDVRLALDCHSMLPVAPPIGATHGEARPLFCLSNGEGATAPTELFLDLASAIEYGFELGGGSVRLNDPFKGGYITRRHSGGRVPWIQVEMNRCLYLSKPWFDTGNLSVDGQRLAELKSRFRDALQLLKL